MKTARILSLALAFTLAALAGCGKPWEPGGNTVAPNGKLAFYNGVSVNFVGDMQKVSEKTQQKMDDKTMFVSVYMLNRNASLGYLAMQVSAKSGFRDMMKEDLPDEDFNAFIAQFTQSMLQRVEQQNPGAPIIGPTVSRQDYTSPTDVHYRITDLKYVSAGNSLNISVLIKVVLSENDLIAIMALEDNNHPNGMADAVFRSIQYE